MNKSLQNSVRLIGYVGDLPTSKTFESGKNATTFRMATHNQYTDTDTGEKVEKTEWHRIIAWGKTADIINKYVKKGKHVMVDGSLVNRSYQKKIKGLKEPITMYTTDIVVDDILFIP